MRILLVCLLLVCTGTLWAQVRGNRTSKKIERLEEQIRQLQQKKSAQSISAAIFYKDELFWQNGFDQKGAHVEETGGKISYRIGSVSKVFTASLMLLMAQEGKLDINKTVSTYLNWQNNGAMTLRQLANHTAGIRHYRHREEQTIDKHYANSLDALEIFQDDPLLFPPGTAYNYSTYGYTLMAAICEKVGNKSYRELLDHYLLEPLNLTFTEVEEVDDFQPNYAAVYEGGSLVEKPKDLSYKWPSGGLRSTMADLVSFGASFHNAADFYVEESLKEAFSPGKLLDGNRVPHAFGWEVDTLNTGEIVYYHDGEAEGGHAHLMTIPDWDISVAIAVNRGSNFSIGEGLELAQTVTGLEQLPFAVQSRKRNQKIGRVVQAFDRSLDQFRSGLAEAQTSHMSPVISETFVSTKWQDKEALLEALNAQFRAGPATDLSGTLDVSIKGIENGSKIIVSNMRYSPIFDEPLLFIFTLFNENWYLSDIQKREE